LCAELLQRPSQLPVFSAPGMCRGSIGMRSGVSLGARGLALA
jgi:hypothetical protein